MGDAKEKRERDTLLYYIRGSLQGRKERMCAAKGRKECLREGIAEKNRGFNGSLTGVKQKIRRGLNKKTGGNLGGS